jgi:hypothetical protein
MNLGHERHVTTKASTQSRSCVEVIQYNLLLVLSSSLFHCRILCEQGLGSIVLRKTVTVCNSSSHALQFEIRFFLHKLKCMKYCRLQLICLPSCVKRNHAGYSVQHLILDPERSWVISLYCAYGKYKS